MRAHGFWELSLPGLGSGLIQTLINLHYYNRDLHAYRQLDASDVLIYEQCKEAALLPPADWSERAAIR